MWSHYFWFLTPLVLVSNYIQSLREGDSCNLLDSNGTAGVCTKIWYCNRKLLYFLFFDQQCGAPSHLTCCEKWNVLINNTGPNVTTTTQRPIDEDLKQTTTEDVFVKISNNFFPETTTSITIDETTPKEKPHGWLKCEEYSKLRDELYGNVDKCINSIQTKIIGGKRTFDGEFPHMAYYKSTVRKFVCGASLITNQYLLTAAHCGRQYEGGRVVMLGSNCRNCNSGISVKVSERIIHPEYNRFEPYYNDIALLRLSEPVNFTQYIWPACLQTNDYVKPKKAIATGWGNTAPFAKESDYLLEVTLPLRTISDCMKANPPSMFFSKGVDEDTMLCAGEKKLKKDTCQGDSGGPLQTLIKQFRCMYTIIGITSFGTKPCGEDIGGYTKVSSFIPWIESIVWPDGK